MTLQSREQGQLVCGGPRGALAREPECCKLPSQVADAIRPWKVQCGDNDKQPKTG